MMSNLQPGTGRDIDRAIEDIESERPCEHCGHDAGECTCLMDDDPSEPFAFDDGYYPEDI